LSFILQPSVFHLSPFPKLVNIVNNVPQNITGLFGLLLLAKEMGLIGGVSPLFEDLRQAGYWISDEIVGIAQGLAGE